MTLPPYGDAAAVANDADHLRPACPCDINFCKLFVANLYYNCRAYDVRICFQRWGFDGVFFILLLILNFIFSVKISRIRLVFFPISAILQHIFLSCFYKCNQISKHYECYLKFQPYFKSSIRTFFGISAEF